MSIKKKLSVGILAGALGVSLIGGGTWAAFNDVETVSNTFAAGTLNLTTSTPTLFNISNLKPGDTFTKTLTLTNSGTLDINDILLNMSTSGWVDSTDSRLTNNGANTESDFLHQFNVTISRGATQIFNGRADALKTAASNLEISGTDATHAALAPQASVTYTVSVEFVNDPTPDSNNSRLQLQNKYQGEGDNITFKFEATQMPGEDRSNN